MNRIAVKVFLLSLLTLSSATALSQNYEEPLCVLAGSECDYYCVTASEHGCTADNYLVRFGGHYCQKFLDDANSYSAHGQVVLAGIRSCLIQSLSRREFSCDNVEDLAFQDHVDCYVDNGFCSLGAGDRARILWSVRSELTNGKFQRAASQIMSACAELTGSKTAPGFVESSSVAPADAVFSN